MKKRLAIISVVIAILVVLISGCSSNEASSTGASENEVASLQAHIETLENDEMLNLKSFTTMDESFANEPYRLLCICYILGNYFSVC